MKRLFQAGLTATAALLVVASARVFSAEARTWTDSTGKHTVSASTQHWITSGQCDPTQDRVKNNFPIWALCRLAAADTAACS